GENARRPDAEGLDGFDAVKPEGWVGPDHAAVIAAVGPRGSTGTVDASFSPRSDPVYLGPCPIPPEASVELDVHKPRIVLVGHGRHGKDTVAEMLRDEYGFSFCSSSLFCAERVMMPAFAQ